ncbi:MAG: SAM-dependent methyltransferase [Oscillospiraceae bacterium]|nr:SAM-dependent methyltransferase [Oscillospiraceae bacterium]
MKQLELTPRLQVVAELVVPGASIADIGTDHAYLPVWLLLQGRVRKAIAADLRQGPLDRARLTARQYECSSDISFRLCDGLEGISPEEVDTIVIAGMGGETIAAILDAASWTRDERYTFILQPMSAQPELRGWLWRNGFDIQKEEVVREGKKLYNIFVARFSDPAPMSLGEEWAGRQSPELVQPGREEYLAQLLEKTERAISGISRGKGEGSAARLDEAVRVRDALIKMKEEWDAWQK